jgi:hypothetical protein
MVLSSDAASCRAAFKPIPRRLSFRAIVVVAVPGIAAGIAVAIETFRKDHTLDGPGGKKNDCRPLKLPFVGR